ATERTLAASAPITASGPAELAIVAPRVATAFGDACRALYGQARDGPDGTRVGALVLLFPDDVELDDDERRFVAAQAAQAATGIVRTQGREREHASPTQL